MAEKLNIQKYKEKIKNDKLAEQKNLLNRTTKFFDSSMSILKELIDCDKICYTVDEIPNEKRCFFVIKIDNDSFVGNTYIDLDKLTIEFNEGEFVAAIFSILANYNKSYGYKTYDQNDINNCICIVNAIKEIIKYRENKESYIEF